MKYTQKTKFFLYGAIATSVLAPLVIYAVETIPVTFAEGDVISASVMNNLLKRINDTQRGFSSNSELIGTWSCTSYSVRTDCTADWVTHSPILKKITQNVVISANGSILRFAAATTNPADCNSSGTATKTLSADVVGGNIALVHTSGMTDTAIITKLSPSKFNLSYAVHAHDNFSSCTKTVDTPVPADGLTVTVSGTNAALSWTDQSSDETGFKVQYKASVRGDWVTVATATENTTAYSVSSLSAGKYWFRVVAFNGNGDAMSSSEVQAEVK